MVDISPSGCPCVGTTIIAKHSTPNWNIFVRVLDFSNIDTNDVIIRGSMLQRNTSTSYINLKFVFNWRHSSVTPHFIVKCMKWVLILIVDFSLVVLAQNQISLTKGRGRTKLFRVDLRFFFNFWYTRYHHFNKNHSRDISSADTRRYNNVIMTSQRRFDIIVTFLLRHVPVGILDLKLTPCI